MSFGHLNIYGTNKRERSNPLAATVKAKRVREVYPSDRIPHLWAHQTQERARNAHGNLFFDGATIYSYGNHFPIASHVKNDAGEPAILFTTRKHSVTTARQVSDVWHAIPQEMRGRTFKVALHDSYGRFTLNHGDNMASYLSDIRDLIEQGDKARGRKASLYLDAYTRIAELHTYIAFFHLKSVAVPVVPMTEQDARAEYQRQEAIKATARAKRDAAQSFERDWNDAHFFNAESSRLQYLQEGKTRWDVERIERSQGYEKALERWMRGENVSLYMFGYNLPTALRIKGEDVETSRGASFPVRHARRGLILVRAVMASGTEWKRNGHTCHLGHYQIDRISPDGTVYAGCHVVPYSAIERIASQLLAIKDGE